MKWSEVAPLLLFILLLGCATSIEDIRSGKIKNHWIVSSMVFTFCFYFFNFMISYAQYVELAWYITRDVSVNSGLALLAGVVLWKAGIWPPGDAKLFFAYTLLVPLSYYANGYLPYFPSFALLVNIFAAGFIYITIMTLIAMLLGFKMSALSLRVKNLSFKRKAVDSSKIKSFAVTLTQKFFVATALIILVTPIREKVFASTFAQYALLLTLVLLFAYGTLQKFILKMFKLWQLFLFVFLYAASGFVIGNGFEFAKHLSVVLKMSLMFMFLGEGAGRLLRLYLDYLGKEEAGKEKESQASLKTFSDYVASESGNRSSNIPFAPVMFCGVLTTLVMKQSVVHYVLHLLKMRSF